MQSLFTDCNTLCLFSKLNLICKCTVILSTVNITLQLTFQDNGSDTDNDQDLSDFTEAGYKLRDQLLPPSLTLEQSQHMSSFKKAKTLQQLFDEQIKNLSTNKSLKNFLDRTVSDVIPCPVEHRINFWRVLEILIRHEPQLLCPGEKLRFLCCIQNCHRNCSSQHHVQHTDSEKSVTVLVGNAQG